MPDKELEDSQTHQQATNAFQYDVTFSPTLVHDQRRQLDFC